MQGQSSSASAIPWPSAAGRTSATVGNRPAPPGTARRDRCAAAPALRAARGSGTARGIRNRVHEQAAGAVDEVQGGARGGADDDDAALVGVEGAVDRAAPVAARGTDAFARAVLDVEPQPGAPAGPSRVLQQLVDSRARSPRRQAVGAPLECHDLAGDAFTRCRAAVYSRVSGSRPSCSQVCGPPGARAPPSSAQAPVLSTRRQVVDRCLLAGGEERDASRERRPGRSRRCRCSRAFRAS